MDFIVLALGSVMEAKVFVPCIAAESDGVIKTRSPAEKPAICRPPTRPPDPPSRYPAPHKSPTAAPSEDTPAS